MSNPTSVIDFTDDLAGFLARTNQFGEKNQDLIQQKRNKIPGDGSTNPGFPATESTSKSVAQWPNMMDDFQLAWANWTGGASTLGFAGSLQQFTFGIKLGTASLLGRTGSPEGVITAVVGSLFLRLDGVAGTTLYTKEVGTGNTGWAPVPTTGGGALTFTTGAPKSGAYTALIGEHVRVDSSAAPTITLDATPATNDRIGVVDTDGGLTTYTAAGGGNNLIEPVTGNIAASVTVPPSHKSFIWKFDGVDSVWRLENV